MLRILKAFLGIVGPSLENIGYPIGEHPKTVLRWRTPGHHDNPNPHTGPSDKREALGRSRLPRERNEVNKAMK